jgi:uncharacterized membrane protein YfcA
MSTGAWLGWIGGILGGLLGLAGGVFGTCVSIRNTQGPRERAFMLRAAVVVWIGLLAFAGLLFGLPDPYRWFAWIPYSILLPLGITYGNRKQQAIRDAEAREAGGAGAAGS